MPHRFKIFFKRKSYYIANSQNLTNSMDGHSKGVIKVARYNFSRPIPPKYEHKLRHHK